MVSISATLCMTLILFVVKNNAYGSSSSNVNYIEVEIKEGNTLWSVALKYMPKNYDVREMVFDIKKFNKIESSFIYPGDIIKIPIIKE